MKTKIMFFAGLLTVSMLLAGCSGDEPAETSATLKPTSTPAASATASPVPSASATSSSEKTAAPATTAPVQTPDPRDDEDAVRAEIQQSLKDAEDLIEEGMYDDANMILRALRSRELTDEELAKVDELQGKLVKISD